MLLNKKGGLVLAGLAAYAFYRYNKMTEQEKRDLVKGVKEKSQKLYDKYAPEEVKKMFDKKNAQPIGAHYGEGDFYHA